MIAPAAVGLRIGGVDQAFEESGERRRLAHWFRAMGAADPRQDLGDRVALMRARLVGGDVGHADGGEAAPE